ncbi:MAG: HD domain-containing protein, partial [Anaerolineales bacterium]|nr:HD domain-containing protein [Anaerolineales bacterium]
PQAAVQEIAANARQILQAKFVYVKIHPAEDDTYAHTSCSGYAPRLLHSLDREEWAQNTFLKTAINALQPFRVRDTRKYAATSLLDIDHASLRGLLVIPIRLHRLSIGTILAFGKQGEVFFTENDESLARLLSIQAAVAFESVWLQQELRNSLTATSLLYQLSNNILQTEELHDAAISIAQTSYKLIKGSVTGIVLFTLEGEIETEVEVDETGAHSGINHPMELINQVLKTGEVIYKSDDKIHTQICLPIQTPLRKYGVLWFNISENHEANTNNPADLQTLANQAALALERSRLLSEWRHQAEELKVALNELELAYDRTLAGLMSSLDARDRETEGHSLRVSQASVKLGKEIGLSASQLKALERGSLLHDIGKIGVSDNILHKPGSLTEKEWESMRLHPDIGARIVEGIPFLQETIPVIRYHQERWDGSGYPLGLSGKDIPLLARIFSAVDVFDALTGNRPYRTKITIEDALEYLRKQSGILLDPEIVEAFIRVVNDEKFDDILLTK